MANVKRKSQEAARERVRASWRAGGEWRSRREWRRARKMENAPAAETPSLGGCRGLIYMPPYRGFLYTLHCAYTIGYCPTPYRKDNRLLRYAPSRKCSEMWKKKVTFILKFLFLISLSHKKLLFSKILEWIWTIEITVRVFHFLSNWFLLLINRKSNKLNILWRNFKNDFKYLQSSKKLRVRDDDNLNFPSACTFPVIALFE